MEFADQTKKRILEAATRLFAAHSYDSISIKQICEAADVNIAAIHYHFESKEKLYEYLLGRFGCTRLDFARKTLQTPKNLEDFKVRLEIFLQETLAAFLEQPEIFTLVQREMERAKPIGTNAFINTMESHAQVLINFFGEAQKNLLLAPELDPQFAALCIIGQVIHLMKKSHRVSTFDPEFRARWVEHTIWLFLNGAIKQ